MTKLFEILDKQKPSFVQKIFKIKPKYNAFIEINNLLATKNINSISDQSIIDIANKYKVDVFSKYKNELSDLYKRYLIYCFEDRTLSDDEILNLNKLKRFFNLKDSDIDSLHNSATQEIFKFEVSQLLKDRRLDHDKQEFLEKLEVNLKLPKDIAQNIIKENVSVMFNEFMNEITSDQRLSPDEEKEMEAIINNFGIELKIDEATNKQLQKYRLFWQIDNGNLPVIDCSIKLNKNENCHFVTDTAWLEQRRITKRINYGGPSLKIKIAKGLYWRTGSVSIQRISEDVWQLIDTGKLFLTNKRIIFMGSKGNKTINLNKILDFEVFSNGIDIQKDTGKSPFLQFTTDTDLFSLILGKLIESEI